MTGHKKSPPERRAFWQNGRRVLQPLPAQVIIQVLVFAVTVRFVTNILIIHTDYGLCGFPSGKIIIKVAMDNRVLLQVNQCFLQVVHGVHHEIVARRADADSVITRLFQCQVREEVHEAFEHANPVLRAIPRMPYQRDVLLFDTSLVVRVAYLIPAGDIAEGKGEIVAFP